MLKSKSLYFIGPVLNDWHIAAIIEKIEEGKIFSDCSIMYCSFNSGRCTSNIFGSKFVCNECVRNVDYIKTNFYPELEFIPVLQKNTYEEGDVLNNSLLVSATSTVTSNLRPVQNEWTVNQKKILEQVIVYGDKFNKEIVHILKKRKIDRIFFYNGRVFPSSILELYASANNIEYVGLELNSSGTQYYETLNYKIHDINNARMQINELVKKQYTIEELKRANNFFEMSRDRQKNYKGIHSCGKKFKNYVAIFTSSDDELSSLGPDWQSEFTKSIPDSIEKIVSRMSHLYFCIRLHPNQMGQGAKIISIYKNLQLKYRNLEMIYPSDRINSYSIIENSDCVISFGSTISVEATFLNKPSVLLGVHMYDKSGVVYTPDSFEELFILLKNKNLNPCNKNGSIAYALYVTRPGNHFRRICGDISRYRLNSIYIMPSASILYLIQKTYLQIKYRRMDKNFKSILRLILIKFRLFNLKNDKSIW